MRLPRRLILAAPAVLAAGPALAQGGAQGGAAASATPDPRMAERGIGRPEAPVRVIEFFSLTCSHCAAFHKETYPRVKRDLVETGTVRLVWRDFPLDRLALVAAQVARSLPAERYEPFIGALLTAQDRWAFTRGDPVEELAKMAALAGMSRAQFDAAARDEGLARAILEMRQTSEREFDVKATPSFAFQSGGRTRTQSGNLAFERFLQSIEEVRRA
jgi:protein-disulfide isomerase